MYESVLDTKTVIIRVGYNENEEYSLGKEFWAMEAYKKAGIPVPSIYAIDTSRTEFPFEYMVMQKLPGQCLGQIWNALKPEEKKQVAFEMGRLLAKMHEVRFEDFGSIGPEGFFVDNDFSFRESARLEGHVSWKRQLLKKTLDDMSILMAMDLLKHEQTVAIASKLHSNLSFANQAEPVLVHNDFCLDHIFVEERDGKWEISGICDFEFAAAYAREYDFIKLHRSGFLDEADMKEALLEGYGLDKLHPEFDEVVAYYRFTRDIGFAAFTAKSGERETSQKALENVLKFVNQ